MERRCHHLMLCRGGSSALTAPLKHCCCCPEHSEHCKLEIQRTSFVKNTSISGGGYSWVREGRWREKSKKASSPALNRNNPVALAGYNQWLYGGESFYFPMRRRQKTETERRWMHRVMCGHSAVCPECVVHVCAIFKQKPLHLFDISADVEFYQSVY